jgi:hypothetical protein
MQRSAAGQQSDELGYAAWFAFWGQLIALGLAAVLGTFFAGRNRAPGDDVCGLALAIAAVALAFMRIKDRFDGGAAADWGSFLLVDDMASLVAAIVVFTVLALGGLFIAAGADHGGLHDAGVALFVTSGLAVFLNLKHVFDRRDRPPRG